MIKKERQNNILNLLNKRKYCTVNTLSKELFVAPITIRRDLIEMENAGLLTRCFGGATTPEHENREIPFEVRNKSNYSEKAELAKKAAKMINTGDVIFMDASSTVSHIAEYISPEQNLTVVTNSTLVAEKMKTKQIRCYLTGGSPVEYSYALVGTIAEQTLSAIYANICFFSSQGISEDGVITDHSEQETNIRRIMIKNSGKQVYLFDSSKYGKRFIFKICTSEDVDAIVTNSEHFSNPSPKE